MTSVVQRLVVPRTVFALAGTHLVVDVFGNAFAPLLPLFIPRFGLSLAEAGAIAMTMQLTSSAAQLAFGPLADVWRPRVLLVVGPVVAVTFLSLAGLATSPLMLAVLLALGCLGSAAFHPAAAALVHRCGSARPGLAMSVHVTGGSIGNAVAPLVFAGVAAHAGLQWTPALALVGLLLLWPLLRLMPTPAPSYAAGPRGLAALRPYALPLSLLWSVVVVRTVVALGFSTFLPVLLTAGGTSVAAAGLVVSSYLLAGSFGGLLGGPLADRFGPRRVIAWSLLAAAPVLALGVVTSGAFAVPLLMLGAALLGSTLPVNVTYAHTLAPVAAGTVSSLMLGVAWGVGGLTVPLVGALADYAGVQAALGVLAALPVLGALVATLLPERATVAAHGAAVAPSAS